MALSLLHTYAISPLLTFDASSWLCIKLIYGALLFNTIPASLIPPVIFSHWNTVCFSCSACLSVGTLGHSSKKLLALLFQIFQIFFQGFLPSFPFCGSQKLTAVTSESLPLHSEFRAMQYQNNAISMIHQRILHWRKWQQKGQENNRAWFWTYTHCRVISHCYSGVLTVSHPHPFLPVWLQDHCCSFLIISGCWAAAFSFPLPFPTQSPSERLLINMSPAENHCPVFSMEFFLCSAFFPLK